MAKLELTWEQIAHELAQWEKKLAHGVQTLRGLGNPAPGGTPRRLVFECGKARLFHYEPERPTVQGVPTLLVYALVNRASMADLEPRRSLVRSLLARGVDLFLIEWADPVGLDAERGLNDYLNHDLAGCVSFLQTLAGPINLMGICQGGTFALSYAAMHPAQIRNLVTTVTPVDFHTRDDALSRLLRGIDLELLGRQNLSGDALNTLFLALRPYRLIHQKYVNLVSQMDDSAALATFLRMEQWIFDSPDLAGRALYEFAQGCYRENALATGSWRIGERIVDLTKITMPVLNIYARDDHLVPPAASLALKALVGTDDYQAVEVPGGHIGIYVGGSARVKVAEAISTWLAART